MLVGEVDGPWVDDGHRELAALSSHAQKERTFAALIRQVERLCRERPVVMLFEDVHWADPTTRELLDLPSAVCRRCACCSP